MNSLHYLLSLVVLLAAKSAALDEETPFAYSALLLPPDLFALSWNFTSTNITFKVTASTRGWVSFGLTQNKASGPNSDLVLAWQSSGREHFKDCHTEIVDSEEKLIYDRVQNWKKLFYSNRNGRVTLIFSRQLELCQDSEELNIPVLPTQFVAWSFGDSFKGGEVDFANPAAAGVSSLPLLASLSHQQMRLDTDRLSTLDFISSVRVTGQGNYFCQMFQLPDEFKATKRHLVKYETLLGESGLASLSDWTMVECIPNYESVFLRDNPTPTAGDCSADDWIFPSVFCKDIGLSNAHNQSFLSFQLIEMILFSVGTRRPALRVLSRRPGLPARRLRL